VTRDQPLKLRLRSGEIAWREIESDVIVLDLRTSRYLSLNRSGARLWRVIAGEVTFDDLVDVLINEFGASPDVARSDLSAFISACQERDLLEFADEATPSG
jgi:hypothetical protein